MSKQTVALSQPSPPPLASELQDGRLEQDWREALGRLGFAEDQLAALIASSYQRAHTEKLEALDFTPSDVAWWTLDYQEVARSLVESPAFRLWIGDLAGHDLKFLQEVLAV